MNFPKVAIIIVTYNAEYYINDCIDSLLKINYPEENFKIFAVDNASKDFSQRLLNEFKICDPLKIDLYISDANSGFAGGNNIGISRAIEAGYDLVYLLNQDTVVEKDFLIEAVKELEKNNNNAGVQSRLMLYSDKALVNSLGNQIHYLGFGLTKSYKTVYSENPLKVNAISEICFASGAACLLRVSALIKSGLFNEDYFMYCEDLDLGWRLRLLGFSFTLATGSVVYHKYKFSSSPAKYYYIERNRLLASLQNYKAATLFFLIPPFVFMESGMILYSALNGWFKEKIRSYLYFLNPANIKKLITRRSKIQQSRVIDDNKIISLFISSINFEEVNNFALNKIANPLLSIYWAFIKKIIFW